MATVEPHLRPSPLRVRRLLHGLRLRDLGDKTGISEATLSRLERGEVPLLGRWLEALARYYATPPTVIRAEMEQCGFGRSAEGEAEGRVE